jgi:hypothetical protein
MKAIIYHLFRICSYEKIECIKIKFYFLVQIIIVIIIIRLKKRIKNQKKNKNENKIHFVDDWTCFDDFFEWFCED